MPVPDEQLSVASLASKVYLRPEQSKELQQSIQMMETMVREPNQAAESMGMSVDPDMTELNLKRDKHMLQNGTVPDYDTLTKNKLNALRKKLEEEIKLSMPSRDMMERPYPDHIDHHIAWERQNKKKILAWKNIYRILDPHNGEPNFTNVARLRTNSPPRVDIRKYWQGFDETQWSDQIEEDLVADLDDDAYNTFLELKLLGWSRPSICKELGWSKDFYDAAMERLRRSRAAQMTRTQPAIDPEEEDEDENETVDTSTLSSSPAAMVQSEMTQQLNEADDDSQAPFRKEWPFPELEANGMTLYNVCKAAKLQQIDVVNKLKHGKLPEEYRQAMVQVIDKFKKAREQMGLTS